jgi:hypothetical protein
LVENEMMIDLLLTAEKKDPERNPRAKMMTLGVKWEQG